MTQLLVALRKELRVHWRTRAQIVSLFVFGAATLLLFSFAIGPNAEALQLHAPAFLWLALLLSSTLALSESFHTETEQRALEGLLLLPASPRALYYGKAIANAVSLTAVGIALLPLMVVLFGTAIPRLFSTIAIMILGCAGVAAPGTLYAAITSEARAKQVLLPLLLFPLIVPVLIAAVKATSLLLRGDPMSQLLSWTVLLVCFDAIYWALCGLLFDRVIEE